MNHTNTTEALKTDEYPHFIKYMGSKTKIMDFVLEGINSVYSGGAICDLFSGSASLAGAIGKQIPIHSNDIQNYSAVVANTYLNSWVDDKFPSLELICKKATTIYTKNSKSLGKKFSYESATTLSLFNGLERSQQQLINRRFRRKWHLFVKNYSGTWWTADQCLWIDALREVIEEYNGTPAYHYILSCLMYAMAYTSQGTGHYAQYRDAKTLSSMKDIMMYRKRSVINYFCKKYTATFELLPRKAPVLQHKVTSLDYMECLKEFEGGTVYADPPYCFVHYSRFYHALETLTLYDYPIIQVKGDNVVKGRYRENRHQSPFCIKTKVTSAFQRMFEGIKEKNSSMVLSYSDTGMISIDEVWAIAETVYGPQYELDLLLTNHKHMTLGRQNDRHREVKECLLLAKIKQP